MLVGNEEEIERLANKDSDSNDYKRIKEKVVGKSFKVHLDINSAFDAFIQHVKTLDACEFLRSKKNDIIDIFNLAGHRNLRHLQQSFLDFERLHWNIDEKYRQIAALMDELLSIYLAFSIEIKAGNISPIDITDLEIAFIREAASKVNREDEATALPIERVTKKYRFINSYDTVLTQKNWREFFDKGFLSKDEITTCLENSRYCQDENTPEWVKLWHYTDLEDSTFEELLDHVIKEWENHSFKEPGEILHIFGLFLRLSHIGLYPKRLSEISQECKKYIDEIKASGEWNNLQQDRFRALNRDQWGGLGYAGSEMQEFNEIYTYLQFKLDEAKIDSLPEKAISLLDILQQDPDEFKQMISLSNSEDQTYRNTPIFEVMNPEEFFKVFMKLPNHQKRIVVYAFQDRYQIHDFRRKRLIKEIRFHQEFDALIKNEIELKKGKITGYVLESFRSVYLKEVIAQLNQMDIDTSEKIVEKQ